MYLTLTTLDGLIPLMDRVVGVEDIHRVAVAHPVEVAEHSHHGEPMHPQGHHSVLRQLRAMTPTSPLIRIHLLALSREQVPSVVPEGSSGNQISSVWVASTTMQDITLSNPMLSSPSKCEAA